MKQNDALDVQSSTLIFRLATVLNVIMGTGECSCILLPYNSHDMVPKLASTFKEWLWVQDISRRCSTSSKYQVRNL